MTDLTGAMVADLERLESDLPIIALPYDVPYMALPNGCQICSDGQGLFDLWSPDMRPIAFNFTVDVARSWTKGPA